MVSPRRGCEQQAFDQYPGHSILLKLRCWSSTSLALLNTKTENARCRTPLPVWASVFALKPTSRSRSSTRISCSLAFETISSRAIQIRSEVDRHRLEAGRANRADHGLRIAVADRDDRATAPAARQFRAQRPVLAGDSAQFLELRRGYLQGVQHALTYIHELAEGWQVIVLYGLNAAQRQGVDLIENPLI